MILVLAAEPVAAKAVEAGPMNWLQFVDNMVGHLAWPLVVLIIAFALRKHLGPLADRVRELTVGPATLKFGDLLEKGAELIEQAPPSLQLPPAPTTTQSSTTVPTTTSPAEPAQAEEPEEPQLPPPIGEAPKPERDLTEMLQRLLSHLQQTPTAVPGTSPSMSALPTAPFAYPWASTNQPWSIISEWNQLEMIFNRLGELLDVKTRNGRIIMDMLYKRELVGSEAVELYGTLRQARNEAVHGSASPSDLQVAEFVRQASYLRDILLGATVELSTQRRSE